MKQLINVILLAVFSFPCLAEVAVIVHPSNSADLDRSKISKIFLGKQKKFSGGATVIPISQNADQDVKNQFDKKVLSKSASQLKAYWSKLLFTGKGQPPKEMMNDKEVISLVSSNPNIIGYIDAKSVDNSVKVVATF